jgi:hypothetical protein
VLRVFETRAASKTFGLVKECTRSRKLECTKTVDIKDILQMKDVKFKKKSLRLRWYGNVTRRKIQECQKNTTIKIE